MPEIIRVKCPHCGTEFDTGDVGDRVNCWSCEKPFSRFTNIVEDDD